MILIEAAPPLKPLPCTFLDATSANSGDKEVVLHAENTTPIQKIIQVMDIGHELGIKVQLAVKKQ